jgi:hypothetical protein
MPANFKPAVLDGALFPPSELAPLEIELLLGVEGLLAIAEG